VPHGGTGEGHVRFNSDSGVSQYSYYGVVGVTARSGSDTQGDMMFSGSRIPDGNKGICYGYITNVSTLKKVMSVYSNDDSNAIVGHGRILWNNIVNAITSIQILLSGGTATTFDYTMKVWGSD
jgi:hypothetical protein